MKRILILALALIMCLSLCACDSSDGGNTSNTSEEKTSEEMAEEAVINCLIEKLTDAGYKNVQCTVSTIEIYEENEALPDEPSYIAYGSVSAEDKYGDTHWYKFDVVSKPSSHATNRYYCSKAFVNLY